MTDQLTNVALQGIPSIDDTAASAESLREKLTDALTPGYQAEFDPEEAVMAGAFKEDALTEKDAAASSDDLANLQGQEEPAFLDDDGPSAEIPTFVTTKNAHELYDLRPGETLFDSIARRNAKGE